MLTRNSSSRTCSVVCAKFSLILMDNDDDDDYDDDDDDENSNTRGRGGGNPYESQVQHDLNNSIAYADIPLSRLEEDVSISQWYSLYRNNAKGGEDDEMDTPLRLGIADKADRSTSSSRTGSERSENRHQAANLPHAY